MTMRNHNRLTFVVSPDIGSLLNYLLFCEPSNIEVGLLLLCFGRSGFGCGKTVTFGGHAAATALHTMINCLRV